ncbi:activity-regulated cytoskeleton associated protein 2-like [Anticarsia gemmatalis]|uniref:activity-regulated cytoskeleton associated protein 2-like n=1 Tax=Anticarsia gemmatalis TaxID=129554 RepID=UPI003F7635F8
MSVNLTDEQFQALLAKLSPGRHGTFSTCTARYDGTKNLEVVEAFLAAATVFKQIENISDAEALTGVPLLLSGEAAIWWQGVKDHVSTWGEFQARLQYTYAPKKPAYILYQEIMGIKQDSRMSTESFVAHKRNLFAQLPEPKQPECHQLDMIYGQLHNRIRERVPRSAFRTFDQLLEAARGVEQMWLDREQHERKGPDAVKY